MLVSPDMQERSKALENICKPGGISIERCLIENPWDDYRIRDQVGIKEKIRLYLDKGAREVWVCSENGEVEIYNNAIKTDNSAFFEHLPKKFEI